MLAKKKIKKLKIELSIEFEIKDLGTATRLIGKTL